MKTDATREVDLMASPRVRARGLMKPSAHIAVVIPAFRVENHIVEVIAQMPSFVRTIIAVDDRSPDATGRLLDELASSDRRLVVIHHERNQGVGGATQSGFREALIKGADIIVKVDGDGQMDPRFIKDLIAPILAGQAEYAKGNRFNTWGYLQAMPMVRKIGNLALSFLIKIASGYWNLFDPTNGFTAISSQALAALRLDRLEQGYLFEISMLVELYKLNSRVAQVPMPAIYNGAASSLRVSKSLIEFPIYLLSALVKRFIHRYVWQDFTAVSVFVVVGLLSIVFGMTFGAYHWIRSLQTMQQATAGTVMLSAMPIILGFQLLLQAIVLDIDNVPK
jgi:dolichol-phosphate mannosyltransferase